MVAFFEEATVDREVGEVPDVIGVVVKIVGAIRPDPRGEPAKGAILDRDVGEDDAIGGFVGK